MAAGRHPSRLFVAAQDPSVLGNLVFNLNLKHLFSSQRSQGQAQTGDECQPPPLLSLPDPVACFKQVHDRMAFAASPSGDVIAAIGANGRTLLYDGAAVSPGPDMRSSMRRPFLVPVGDHMFFAISAYPRLDVPQGLPRFEALQKLRRPGGRWAWTTVLEPPGLAHQERKDVTAYFVSGARVYVSLERQGTYSYDTARRRWRTEGAWELPLLGRGLLVPNFLGTGRRLLFGFRDMDDPPFNQEFPFCAVDMDARPPVVVESWPEAARFFEAWRAGYNMCLPVSQLNYFGGGRFCISVTSHSTEPERARHGVVSFTAVELTADLHLLMRQYSCYLMPESSRYTYADVI